MSAKPPECWATDSQSEGLRIELTPELILVLPYDEFHLAELKAAGADHRLHLVFSQHEVIIVGHNLKRVLIAMQKKELAVIAKMPAHSQSLIVDGAPLIHDIVVNEKTLPASQATE